MAAISSHKSADMTITASLNPAERQSSSPGYMIWADASSEQDKNTLESFLWMYLNGGAFIVRST